MAKLPILKIQRFCTGDGVGIRTTVFTKGCPLRCFWCHNPESQTLSPNLFYQPNLCIGCGSCAAICKQHAHVIAREKLIFQRIRCTDCGACATVCPSTALENCVKELSIDEIFIEIKKDLPFYGNTGGLTLSGGEPLLHGKNILSLIRKAKSESIDICVETCGQFSSKYIPELAKTINLFLFDLKDTNATRFHKNTGGNLQKILKNLFAIDNAGGKTVLRCILLNGVNDDIKHLDGIVNIYKRLSNCKGVEIFTYHGYGESKYAALGLSYTANDRLKLPKSALKKSASYLKRLGVPCKITGEF
jgi:pyruvate formate lyase activating enzyme